MKISVIIPVYNVEGYLRQCLDSVFRQETDDFEVICINDGSTDACPEILLEYEKTYGNMLVLTISNHGAGFARNVGIRQARGAVCCFIDPDDWYPEADILARMYEQMIMANVEICGGSAQIVREKKARAMCGEDLRYRFSQNQRMEYSDYQWDYGFWRFMYKTDFLRRNHIWFPDYRRYQDPPFMVNAMVTAGQFYAMKDITYAYRKSGKTVEYTYEKTRDLLRGHLDVLALSKKNNLADLNRLTVERLNTVHCLPIYYGIIQGHQELLQLLDLARAEVISDEPDEIEFAVEEKLRNYQHILKNRELFNQPFLQFEIIILYGAGEVGKQVADYLKRLKGNRIIFFAVSEKQRIETEVYQDIAVRTIAELQEYKTCAYVLITVKEGLHRDMKARLKRLGFAHTAVINYKEFSYFSRIFDE